MELSLLDVEIDEDATVKEAKKLLGKPFEKYLNLSGIHRTDLSSLSLDPTGVSSHGGANHTEDKFILGIEAANRVNAISHAINDCSKEQYRNYAELLYDRYVKRMSVDSIMGKMGIEDSQYYRLHKRALLQFAQKLELWKRIDHCTDMKCVIVWKDAPESL